MLHRLHIILLHKPQFFYLPSTMIVYEANQPKEVTMKIKLKKLLSESGYGGYITQEDLSYTPGSSCLDTDTFLLLEGHLDVTLESEGGNKVILERVHPSDHQIGGIHKDNFLDLDIQNRCYSFSKNSKVLTLSEDVVERLQQNHEFIQMTYEKNFSYFMKKLRENRLRHSMNVEEFISYYISSYSVDDIYYVGSYSSLAQILKCDRANLYRGISSLEKKGIIEKTKKELIIRDHPELKKIFRDKL